MGMSNKHPGYIYLVDENAKIRWAAVSSAQRVTEEAIAASMPGDTRSVDEVKSLASCINVLLQRLRDGNE